MLKLFRKLNGIANRGHFTELHATSPAKNKVRSRLRDSINSISMIANVNEFNYKSGEGR